MGCWALVFARVVARDYHFGVTQGPHILPSIPRMGASIKRTTLPYEPVCAIFRRYLHEQKLKFTPERAMMLDAVLRKQRLFEPDDLIADLKALGHRVSRATVYRTLAHLQDAGVVKQVFFDNRQSYYEVIVGRETHDYLICVASGRVVELSSERLKKLRDDICREHGYQPLSHQFHIFAISPEAQKETGSAASGNSGRK
jgi:Fur family transcriptional regulator, ferric uptake regulator